jgi:hypothetical protein
MSTLRLRPYGKPLDRDFCVAHWLRSWSGSAYGRSLGAHVSRSKTRDAWWALNGPYVARLLAEQDTVLLCSESDEDVVLGFACSGQDVLHYLLVHRRYHQEGLSRALYEMLLGDRWSRDLMVSHELMDLKEARLSMPDGWILDTYYNARRMKHAA